MSREVLVRIRPGETVDAFTTRIADSAPPLTPELAARLRTLLPIDAPVELTEASQREALSNAA